MRNKTVPLLTIFFELQAFLVTTFFVYIHKILFLEVMLDFLKKLHVSRHVTPTQNNPLIT